MPSVLASSPMRARSVRRPSTGVRSSLKSPECRITPCGVCTAMAWAWGTLWVTGMNSTSKGPIWMRSPSVTVLSVGASEQPGFLDPVAGQAEGQRRAVDRQAHLAQQELDAADVVLVAVRGDEAVDALGVLAEVREVRQHEVDAVHVGTGEHQPAVDEQDPAVVAEALFDRPCSCGRSPRGRPGRRARTGVSHGRPSGPVHLGGGVGEPRWVGIHRWAAAPGGLAEVAQHRLRPGPGSGSRRRSRRTSSRSCGR